MNVVTQAAEASLRGMAWPPLCRRVTARDLTLWGLGVDVPAGFVGVLGPGERILPPGRHTVRPPWSRHMPALHLVFCEPFLLTLRADGLLTGGPDGELVAALLTTMAAATAPARLLQTLAHEGGQAGMDDLTQRLEPWLAQVLKPVVRQYLAADLIGSGLAAPQVLSALTEALADRLADLGLAVRGTRALSFQRSTDVIMQAERARELRQKLLQAQLMDHLERLLAQAIGEAEAPALPLTIFQPEFATVEGNFLIELRRLRGIVREARSSAFRGGDLSLAFFLRDFQNRITLALGDSGEVQPYAIHTACQSDGRDLAMTRTWSLAARLLADTAHRAFLRLRKGDDAGPDWLAVADAFDLLRQRLAMVRPGLPIRGRAR